MVWNCDGVEHVINRFVDDGVVAHTNTFNISDIRERLVLRQPNCVVINFLDVVRVSVF